MKKVVACIDGAAYSEAVCDYASWAAIRFGIPLEFLHVLVKEVDVQLDASGSIGLGAQESLLAELAALDERLSTLAREHGKQILEGARQRASAIGAVPIDTLQRHGEFVDTLIAMEADTRLFVLGQHDEQGKPKPLLLDHNLESAIRALRRPILVATADFKQPQHFMIAFDGSVTGKKIVDMVAESPLLKGLRCTVALVGKENDALHTAAKQLAERGFDAEARNLQGDPADALLTFAQERNVDMLVMGAYGHSRIRQWVVGSTTTSILQKAQIPVFILR